MRSIRLILSKEEFARLDQLKEVYNEKTYTKVLRILIREKFLKTYE